MTKILHQTQANGIQKYFQGCRTSATNRSVNHQQQILAADLTYIMESIRRIYESDISNYVYEINTYPEVLFGFSLFRRFRF